VKAGKLPEAESLTDQMKLIADSVIWRKITGACRTHGNCQVMEVKKEPGLAGLKNGCACVLGAKRMLKNIKKILHVFPPVQLYILFLQSKIYWWARMVSTQTRSDQKKIQHMGGSVY
jgi:hypothetical protein